MPLASILVPPAARLALLLARSGFRSRSTYRAALLGGIVTNSVFGLIRASVLLYVVARSGGAVAGYDAASMAAYVWLGQATMGVVQLYPRPVLGGRVRTGDIAVDYARPLDIQGGYLAQDLGASFYGLIPRSLPTLAIGLAVSGWFLPRTILPYAVGLLSLVLAVVVSYLARLALELLSFWFVEVRGFTVLYMAAGTFLAGLYVPLALMPDWLQRIAWATPFPSLLQYPVDLLSGRVTGLEALAHLGTQAGWIVALTLLGRAMLAAGHRHLVVQGG